MTELKEAEDRMSLTIPLGKEGDEISSFSVERAMGECMGRDKDVIWELINPDLDRLLGFGRPAGEIQSLLRRGNMGMTGFRGYLTHLIEEGGVEGVMLEGKVERLIDAINKTYVLFPAQPSNDSKKGLQLIPLLLTRLLRPRWPHLPWWHSMAVQ